ncbi:MAG: P-loop NTPase [Deltaproteobacteria bacterium]|jgi:pilus assembly protein CpaE|nr:P-loop NTPase [Deltaproteobacteria bacterium]
MPINSAFVKLKIKDQEFINIFSNIFKEIKNIEIINKTFQQQPDLIIFELGQNYETDLEYVQAFLDKNEKTEFFLISKSSDQDILIKALRIGVKEFFPVPLETGSINEALIHFQERREKQYKKRGGSGQVFTVAGSKGGVGTTTIATNLAVTLGLKQKKTSVALLDMNDVFGEIPMFLDLTPKYNWGNITKNIERLDHFFLSSVLSEHKTGIHVLPSPRFLNDHPPTPEIIATLLDLMKVNFDYIVIDMGQSINETAFKIFQISDLLLFVTIQSLPCLANTNMLINSFMDYGFIQKKNINIVLNRYIKKGTVSIDDAQEGIGKKISWVIPNDYQTTMSAINSGKPLYQIAPKSKIVKSFNEYAGNFFPDENKNKKKWGWFS